MAENNSICVITPPLSICSQVVNLNISHQDNTTRIIPVTYSHQDKYVLMSKNGTLPDVILDKSTIDLICKTRYIENTAENLAHFIKTNPDKYDPQMLDDKKAITEILTEYTNTSSAMPFSHIINNAKNAQKYRR